MAVVKRGATVVHALLSTAETYIKVKVTVPADSLIWLDPPSWVRAWRLAIRPLRNFGRTRPELPSGNVDWPWEQYRFAIRSLRYQAKFQENIACQLAVARNLHVWRIRKSNETSNAMDAWRMAAD